MRVDRRAVTAALTAALITAAGVPATAAPDRTPPLGACAGAGRGGAVGSPALAPGLVVWQQDVSHRADADVSSHAAAVLSSAGPLRGGACGGTPGTTVSAPSVTTGPDGTQWAVTAQEGSAAPQVLLHRRTRDGWTSRVVAAFDGPQATLRSHLPPTVAVDPRDPRHVHVAYTANLAPLNTVAVHRSSRDGGRTWSEEHVVSAGASPLLYDFAEQLVALADGTLLALSTEVDVPDLVPLAPTYLANGDLTQAPVVVRARRSTDDGRSWSLPVTVLDLANGSVRDPERPSLALRSLVRPSVAVAPDGAVLVAGESVGAGSTSLLLGRSTDGGRTWTVRPAATVHGLALHAAVAVDDGGRVAVSFLDLSEDVPGDAPLQARWRLVEDGRSTSLSAPFDLRRLAPAYVGDQGALLGERHGFTAALVVGTGAEDPSDLDLVRVR